MWQQNYEPVGGSLAWSALCPHRFLSRCCSSCWACGAALADRRADGAWRRLCPGPGGVWDAGVAGADGRTPPAPRTGGFHCLDRVLVDPPVSTRCRHRQVRDHQGPAWWPDHRPPTASIVHRLLVWRVHRGAAGFGAPVAVAGASAGLGFSPFYAAGICLMADTVLVAFGSIGIPVTTLAGITGLPVLLLSAMVGRWCALISLIIPTYLVVVMAGWRRTSRCCQPSSCAGVVRSPRCSSTCSTSSAPN